MQLYRLTMSCIDEFSALLPRPLAVSKRWRETTRLLASDSSGTHKAVVVGPRGGQLDVNSHNACHWVLCRQVLRGFTLLNTLAGVGAASVAVHAAHTRRTSGPTSAGKVSND